MKIIFALEIHFLSDYREYRQFKLCIIHTAWHHFTLPEAADLAQNHPLWRMMSTYGATQLLHARNDDDERRDRQMGVMHNVAAA